MVGVIVGHGERVIKDRSSLKKRYAVFAEVEHRLVWIPTKSIGYRIPWPPVTLIAWPVT